MSNKTSELPPSMSETQYMQERVDDQLNWYSNKSTYNKNWFHRLQVITLVAAASIPVLTLVSSDISMRILVACVGAIAAVAAGVTSLCRFRDLWVDYRATAEILKNEKYLYLTRSGPYDGEGAFNQFVLRVENILAQENQGWQQKKLEIEMQSSAVSDDG